MKIPIIIIGMIVIAALGIFIYAQLSSSSMNIEEAAPSHISNVSFSATAINVPAVDENGNGVTLRLRVQSVPGYGRALVNVDNLLFWVDTQYSIRVAKDVAENITGADLSGTDLIYNIESNASVIEGQSAGAALTIATIAALENKTLNNSVMITGTINPDGSIGPIGGVEAKANASKQIGADMLILPKGQGILTNYIPDKTCKKYGPITFCNIEYNKETVNVSKEMRINIKEVSTIDEALKYFLI